MGFSAVPFSGGRYPHPLVVAPSCIHRTPIACHPSPVTRTFIPSSRPNVPASATITLPFDGCKRLNLFIYRPSRALVVTHQGIRTLSPHKEEMSFSFRLLPLWHLAFIYPDVLFGTILRHFWPILRHFLPLFAPLECPFCTFCTAFLDWFRPKDVLFVGFSAKIWPISHLICPFCTIFGRERLFLGKIMFFS